MESFTAQRPTQLSLSSLVVPLTTLQAPLGVAGSHPHNSPTPPHSAYFNIWKQIIKYKENQKQYDSGTVKHQITLCISIIRSPCISK